MKKLFSTISLLLILSFSFSQNLIVNSINFEGNKVTKDNIISIELNIKTGDTLCYQNIDSVLKLNASKIYNLQLFHWVKSKYKIKKTQFVDITFSIQERWYVWPIPIFSLADRNLNAWLNKMDFNRIDYGIHTAWYNFRGRNEKLISNIQYGFNRKYELFYTTPQINKKQNIGLEFGGSFYQSHYLDYSNIDGKPTTLRLENEFPINKKYLRFGLINRNSNENIRNLRFELNSQNVSDSILKLNPFYHLKGNSKTYFQFEVNQILNKRKTFSYPLSGSFLEISYRQRFFINNTENPSSRFRLDFSKYIPITKKSFYSIGLNSQYTYNTQISTSENIALGYKKNIRGFDFFVIDGQNFLAFKQNINTTIFSEKSIQLNFLPSDKFNSIPISVYGGLFSDIGYVWDNKYAHLNSLSNELLYSVGAGIHFVSYYDQVFVIEYTLNSLMKHGIFVSTKFSF